MVDTAINYQTRTGVPAENSYPKDVTRVGFALVDPEWSNSKIKIWAKAHQT